jgi:hypothetical protein
MGCMGRFASAFTFLSVLAVVLLSAGCGQRFDDLGDGTPPTEAQLASEALTALEAEGSAHVVLDTQTGTVIGTEDAQIGVHFEGDVSSSALVGDATVAFAGATLGARLEMNKHDLDVRFAGQWYHADAAGIQDALAKVNEGSGPPLTELLTASGFGRIFDDLFTGEVGEGPVLDGARTWQFEGRLDADTVARYIKEYAQDDLSESDRQLVQKVAETSNVVLVAGQADHLPRKIELTLAPPKGLSFDSDLMRETSGKFTLTLGLSDFGKDVSFETPKDAKPLSELAGQLFSAFE